MKQKQNQYETTFELRHGVSVLRGTKYESEYGFGFNMPAIIYAKDLKHAWVVARKKVPKDCKVTSVKRVRN